MDIADRRNAIWREGIKCVDEGAIRANMLFGVNIDNTLQSHESKMLRKGSRLKDKMKNIKNIKAHTSITG